MQWFEIDDPKANDFPVWAKSFSINDEGRLFVPAAIAKVPEQEVFLCTLSDSIPSILHKNHRYVPAKWLATEFPKASELCRLIEAAATELLSRSSK